MNIAETQNVASAPQDLAVERSAEPKSAVLPVTRESLAEKIEVRRSAIAQIMETWTPTTHQTVIASVIPEFLRVTGFLISRLNTPDSALSFATTVKSKADAISTKLFDREIVPHARAIASLASEAQKLFGKVDPTSETGTHGRRVRTISSTPRRTNLGRAHRSGGD